jgi:NADPH2:quinone reductase
VIYRVFPAAQAVQAHELMESNQHIGKLVLDWAPQAAPTEAAS